MIDGPVQQVRAGTTLLATEADTERLGARIGASLSAGDVVLLSGPLGAGKTVLARGIGRGLGVAGPVTSPTFVIAREHPAAPGGRGVALVHVDAYRLGGRAELDDLDLDTDLAAAAVVVEWGEDLADRLAGQYLLVRLTRRDDDSRVAEIVRRVSENPTSVASGDPGGCTASGRLVGAADTATVSATTVSAATTTPRGAALAPRSRKRGSPTPSQDERYRST
jgi:tRNA threonylcarbamoyladenosine biosynthesis protein TsaE